jgi:hypothetical protein|uniref:Uncharacterized protein n=1 Tax=Picea glauca TaxID=3330 RepID=A0A101LWA9_PICGL|nr:hypothetical protein ABT39_MTgene1626 [Picea glauca]
MREPSSEQNVLRERLVFVQRIIYRLIVLQSVQSYIVCTGEPTLFLGEGEILLFGGFFYSVKIYVSWE